jgi:hypothetical protein
MDNRTLFNCCTNNAEPDWSQFTNLELAGCRDVAEAGDDSTWIESGFTADEAEFFTIYGRDVEGCCEAITDIQGTFCEAEVIARFLSSLSGLDLITVC